MAVTDTAAPDTSTADKTPPDPSSAFPSLAPPTVKEMVIGLVNSEGTPGLDFPEMRIDIEAAIDYLNQHGGMGGRPIKLETCATKASPESSQACAQVMAGKNVEARTHRPRPLSRLRHVHGCEHSGDRRGQTTTSTSSTSTFTTEHTARSDGQHRSQPSGTTSPVITPSHPTVSPRPPSPGRGDYCGRLAASRCSSSSISCESTDHRLRFAGGRCCSRPRGDRSAAP